MSYFLIEVLNHSRVLVESNSGIEAIEIAKQNAKKFTFYGTELLGISDDTKEAKGWAYHQIVEDKK